MEMIKSNLFLVSKVGYTMAFRVIVIYEQQQ